MKMMTLLQIKNIQEDVEYYIENFREPDFAENEMMYEDIDGLEEMLDVTNVNSKVTTADQHTNNSVSETSETMSTNSANSPIPFPSSVSGGVASSGHNHSNDNESKRRHKSSGDDGKVRHELAFP